MDLNTESTILYKRHYTDNESDVRITFFRRRNVKDVRKTFIWAKSGSSSQIQVRHDVVQ